MNREPAKLEYVLEGPEGAPVLVMANSLGTTWEMWEDQRILAQNLRLLRYNHRGHGGSSEPPGPYTLDDLGGDLLALLDDLNLRRVSFCGLSVGGMVGMWLAGRAPERVERLALLCTSALLGPPETWDERAKAARQNGVASLVPSVVERWFTPAFRRNDPERVEKVARMLESTPAEGYAGCCEAIRDADLRPELPKISAPTLILAGADDPATPPDHAAEIHASVRNSNLLVVPEAAHLANIEQPEKVGAALAGHFEPVRAGGER